MPAGFKGSVDVSGFRMEHAPDGAPRFKPAAPNVTAATNDWDPQFNAPGVDFIVYAMAVSGSDLYVGGIFSSAGTVTANNIAKWNGSTWSALGSGVDGYVLDILPVGSDVYVCGIFSNAGGVNANSTAKWNGNAWSALGDGITGLAYSMAVIGSDLYVAGDISEAGGVSVNNIAKWNGSAWSALDDGGTNGFPIEVYSLAVVGNGLFVGGYDEDALTTFVGKWNGVSWSTLNGELESLGNFLFFSAFPTGVFALKAIQGDLYAGGNFTRAGGKPSINIGKYNFSNPPGIIAAGPLTRQQGSPRTVANLATVSDTETPAGGLIVTATTVPAGISITSISNSNGAISASIAASCTAALGSNTIVLTVTDGDGVTATANLIVTVTGNGAASVGNYPNTTAPANTNASILPDAAPMNPDSIAMASAMASPANFTGSLLVNPATGEVQVTNAGPVGLYTITVTFTSTCGATTNRSFTLNVVCETVRLSPAPPPEATVNTSYSQGVTASPAGGNYTFSLTNGILPVGLSLNSATGAITGAPALDGVFNFRVTATGFGSCTGFRDFVLIVNCASIAVGPSSLPGGTVGTAYNQTITASPVARIASA